MRCAFGAKIIKPYGLQFAVWGVEVWGNQKIKSIKTKKVITTQFFLGDESPGVAHVDFETIMDTDLESETTEFSTQINFDNLVWSNCDKKQAFIGHADIDIISNLDNEEISIHQMRYFFQFRHC
jgi:hypothetical protein